MPYQRSFPSVFTVDITSFKRMVSAVFQREVLCVSPFNVRTVMGIGFRFTIEI